MPFQTEHLNYVVAMIIRLDVFMYFHPVVWIGWLVLVGREFFFHVSLSWRDAVRLTHTHESQSKNRMIFVTSALIISIPTLVCVFLLIDLHIIVVITVALITAFTVITYWYVLFFFRSLSLSLSLSLSVILVTSVQNRATACQNPGVFPRHYHIPRTATKKWMYSGQSKSYRPPGVRYCSECQVQIKNIDHFCPWTGTTIGANNFPCFKMFTSSLCLLIILVIVFAIIATVSD